MSRACSTHGREDMYTEFCCEVDVKIILKIDLKLSVGKIWIGII
jgi:hypothetical protein